MRDGIEQSHGRFQRQEESQMYLENIVPPCPEDGTRLRLVGDSPRAALFECTGPIPHNFWWRPDINEPRLIQTMEQDSIRDAKAVRRTSRETPRE